jgi:hypothetical protein
VTQDPLSFCLVFYAALSVSGAWLNFHQLWRCELSRCFASLEKTCGLSWQLQPFVCPSSRSRRTSSPCAGSPLGRRFSRSFATCGRSRFPSPSGTLRLSPLGHRPSPARRFLRGLSPPWALHCCASDGVSNGTRCARHSFCDSVHARLSGVS